MSLAPSSVQFDAENSDPSSRMIVSAPKAGASSADSLSSETLYTLHRSGSDPTIQSGAAVMSQARLCPPFSPDNTTNLFGHLFGIEYKTPNDTYVRPISLFEFARCFNLMDDLTYRLSHESNKFYLDAGVPAFTSAAILASCHERLISIRDANLQLFEPNSIHAPAAMAPVFVNGAVGTRLPDAAKWKSAYQADPQTRLIMELIANPGRIKNDTLKSIHASFRMPLRQSLLVVEDDMLIYREPLGDGSDSFCRLRVVPQPLQHILFVAFHANPIGGHLNAARTYRNLRLRYYWPGMFTFVKKLCSQCPGCALANRTHGSSRELVYSFPISAPMMVIHIDGYEAGRITSFEGESAYLVAACGMTTFAMMEPVKSKDAKGFASALMKILLRFGLCHTLVIDKASVFFSVFKSKWSTFFKLILTFCRVRIMMP